MQSMNLKALREHRAALKTKYSQTGAAAGNTTRIIVGMGTCGIAAGAREAWNQIRKSLAEFGIEADVTMKQTGCMGLCQVEPTVEIIVPGMPAVIYGKVTAEVAARLVRKHIIEKTLLDGHIQDRPASDIVAGPAARAAGTKGGL